MDEPSMPNLGGMLQWTFFEPLAKNDAIAGRVIVKFGIVVLGTDGVFTPAVSHSL